MVNPIIKDVRLPISIQYTRLNAFLNSMVINVIAVKAIVITKQLCKRVYVPNIHNVIAVIAPIICGMKNAFPLFIVGF